MQGVGTIKAVLSGDTIVLQGASKPGTQAPELQLSLSHLSAPRIARHSDARDEPFGWPAREFLRRYAIGKQARFKVDYKLEKSGRLFASLWLLESPAESINAFVARHGWARVEPAKATGRSEEYETLATYGKAAEEAGVGVYCAAEGVAEATVRSISWALPPADAPAVAEALKAAPQPAIVEGVAGSAGQLRVLLTATSPSLAVTFILAGVQAPRVPAGTAAPTPTVAVPSAAPAAAAPAPGTKVRLAAPAAGSALLGAEEAAPSVKPSWATKGASAAAGSAAAPAAAARPAAGGAGGSAAPVASPTSPAAAATSEAAVAVEARSWLEARLLHRDVLLHVGGADKHGNLVGRLEASAGALFPLPGYPTAAASAAVSPSGGSDPALDLLRIGAAKVADWSLAHLPGGAAAAATLRAAERAAKGERQRLWAGYTAPAAPVVRGERRFDGRISEVLSGDTVIVAVPRAPGVAGPAEERRVSLASVRAPRMGARGGADAQPWAAEAREFLRKTLVGRDVSVTIDYARVVGGAPAGGAGADGAAAADERPGVERQFGTVLYSTRKGEAQHNVAVELVGEGFAEVIRHRGDEDRASAHEELLAAEEAARTAKRGMHSGKAPVAARKPVDVSQDSARTKAALPSLMRARTLRGVVDFVFAGGRVKVTVPSENITFVFGLAGVRCPSTAKAGGKGADGKPRPARAAEPGGPEALQWTREHCLQQDVELEVEDVDKTGSVLLGSMWVGRGGARRSAAEELLRAGLATTIPAVVTRVKGSAELLAAEGEAKAARIGVWEGYVEPKAGEDEDDVDYSAAAAAGGEEGGADAGAGAEGGAAAAGGDFPALGGAGAAAGAGAGARRAAGAGAASGPKPPAGLVFVTVCDISDGSTFFVQEERDKSRLAEVNARMAALLESVGTQSAPVEAGRGKLVACLFAESGADGKPVHKWFRARIEGKSKDAEGAPRKTAEGLDLWAVQYVDFGNRADVTVQSMRPLPDASLAALPAIAKECGMALLRVPAVSSEEGEAAAVLLGDMTFGRRVLMRVHSRDPVSNKAMVSLYEPITAEDGSSITAGACVNEALVTDGLARISGREAKRVGRRTGAPGASAAAAAGASADAELLARLRSATETAKKARAGIFAYGDAGDSEDEEKPRAGGKGGRR